MDKDQVVDIDDIESGLDGIPYTDGAGFISSKLSQNINDIFGLESCVAYQIRLAGYKGVLLLKKGKEMRGIKIQCHNSMKKFESDKLELGVIRCATPSISYLNR